MRIYIIFIIFAVFFTSIPFYSTLFLNGNSDELHAASRKKKKKYKKKKRKKRKRRKKAKKKKNKFRFQVDTKDIDRTKLSQVLNAYLDEDYEDTIAYASPLLRNKKLKRAASYYIALALAKMELYGSAIYYFGEIVKMDVGETKSTKRYYQQAVNSLLQIADEISDEKIIPYLLKDVSIKKIGIRKKDKFHYYLGKYYYFTGQYARAVKTLKEVTRKGVHYSRARYIMGVIYAINKRYREALNVFRRVTELSDKEIGSELIRDKAHLAIARLFYGFGKYRLAQVFYEKITDESPLWMETVFESSWSYYMGNNYNKVLGKLEVINSPFFDDKFEPEFYVLRLVVLLKLCRVIELKPFIVKFNKSYTNMIKPIAKYASQYSGNKEKIFQTLDHYFRGDDNLFGLPKRLVAHIAMEQAVYSSYYNIYSILDEKDEIDRLRHNSKAIVFYKRLSKRLSGYVSDLKEKVAKIIIKRVKYYFDSLGDQIDRARLVRLEYMDEEKALMEKAMVVYNVKKTKVDLTKPKYVEVPEDYIYWPFEGEYWRDELGYHEFRMESACREDE